MQVCVRDETVSGQTLCEWSLEFRSEHMLGHSRIQMVLRYAHPTQQHQTLAMEKMERYVAEQQIESFDRQQNEAANLVQ